MIPNAIGHFLIKAKIGEGGMGEVYLAKDKEAGARRRSKNSS